MLRIYHKWALFLFLFFFLSCLNIGVLLSNPPPSHNVSATFRMTDPFLEWKWKHTQGLVKWWARVKAAHLPLCCDLHRRFKPAHHGFLLPVSRADSSSMSPSQFSTIQMAKPFDAFTSLRWEGLDRGSPSLPTQLRMVLGGEARSILSSCEWGGSSWPLFYDTIRYCLPLNYGPYE